jgi:hypothetical protein
MVPDALHNTLNFVLSKLRPGIASVIVPAVPRIAEVWGQSARLDYPGAGGSIRPEFELILATEILASRAGDAGTIVAL